MGVFSFRNKRKKTRLSPGDELMRAYNFELPELEEFPTEPVRLHATVQKEPMPERTRQTKREEIEHYIVSQCELIMENSKELQECDKEYRLVTEHLEDMEKLQNLSPKNMDELKEAATNVQKLSNARENFRREDKRLTDAQFLMMQQLEDDMPDEIKRLQANEKYQDAVKRDMQYLAGEKDQLAIRKETLEKEQTMIQKMFVVLLGICVLSFVLLFIMQNSFHIDCTNILFFMVFIVALVTFGLFMKRQYNVTELHKIGINRSYAIEMENKMKIKYVNITNAVDYGHEKFHVHDSKELMKELELYMDMVKQRKKYMETSEDLEYYESKLMHILEQCELADPKLWSNQIEVLWNEKELQESREDLTSRQKKLRERMDNIESMIQKARAQVNYLSKNMDKCSASIMEIVLSVNQLCQGI